MSRKRDPRPYKVTVVRYELPDGRRCKKGDPGARPVRTRTETWYADLPDEAGELRRTSLGTTDQGQAWVELRRRQREAELRARGIVDEYAAQAVRPLAEHLDDWQEVLRAKGTGEEQVANLRHSVETLAALAGWRRVTDLDHDSCLLALGRLRDEATPRFPKGRSAQTRNHYLSHVKQFCAWCLRGKRLREHPLLSIAAVSVEEDRRHDRRCPSDEEVARLFAHLAGPDARVRCRMTGPQRALGYQVSMATGFRADELRSLSRESFDLEAAVVTVQPAYDKRRRLVRQQLPAWLVAELRAWFAAGGGTWEHFPPTHPGRVLKGDLEGAGVPYAVQGPEGHPLFFDFHSLRVWYCTTVASQPNMDVKTLMELCRHSTPALTLKVYAKGRDSAKKAAVEQIPQPGRPPKPVQPEPPAASPGA